MTSRRDFLGTTAAAALGSASANSDESLAVVLPADCKIVRIDPQQRYVIVVPEGFEDDLEAERFIKQFNEFYSPLHPVGMLRFGFSLEQCNE